LLLSTMKHLAAKRVAVVLLVVTPLACGPSPEADPHMVSEWERALYGVVRAERLSPPVASRVFAYASVGLYSGLTAARPGAPSLTKTLNGLDSLPHGDAGKSYDATLTAVAAEHTVLDSLFAEGLPTTRAALSRLADSLEQARKGRGVGADVATQSTELGRRIGLAIVSWAHGDGFDSTRGKAYVAPVGAGLWVNDDPATVYATQNLSGASQAITPSNPANAFKAGTVDDRSLILDRPKRAGRKTLPAANMAGVTEPYWGYIRPFALHAWDDCPAPLPPAFSLTPGTPLYEEARVVWQTGKSLTPAQRETALYWADNGGETGTPAGHWLSIASQMVTERHLTAEQAAWVMVGTSVALNDAFISAWGYKFRLNLIRPRTFIRETMDSTWEPAIPTPPFPEYLSGHSTISAAAAGAMTAVLGAAPFEDSTSIPLGHAVRKFDSFRDAAIEAGMSRIYGGIHFPSGNLEGRKLGDCIASKVAARLSLKPL
jgi:hypothetical protein